MRHLITILSAFAVSISTVSSATAEPAVSFGQFDISGTANNSTRGWSFDVIAPEGILLTGLGLFDLLADGLVYSHQIGVWDPSRNIIVSAVVPAGTLAPLDTTGLFRTVLTPEIHLPQGTGYVIAALYTPDLGEDFQAAFAQDFQVADALAYGEPRFLSQFSPVLMYPTDTVPIGPGLFGPSFQFEPVPEPSSLGLLLTSIIGLVAFSRLRQYES